MRELADSYQGPLSVRIWEQDRYREQYYRIDWPEDWVFYESGAEWCGEALHEYWENNKEEAFYGFIGDDIILERGTLKELEDLAGDYYISYPNDTIHRQNLTTHFCVGGELCRLLGRWVLPELKHNYLDLPFTGLGHACGILRYAPGVIFRHKHFFLGAERDETYKKVYGDYMLRPINEMEPESKRIVDEYLQGGIVKDAEKIRSKFLEWENGK